MMTHVEGQKVRQHKGQDVKIAQHTANGLYYFQPVNEDGHFISHAPEGEAFHSVKDAEIFANNLGGLSLVLEAEEIEEDEDDNGEGSGSPNEGDAKKDDEKSE